VSSLKIKPIEVTRLSPAETRIAMSRNGYSPLPCHGKRPAMDEWQKRHDTNEREILLWDRVFPYDGNTGCLTRNTPTLDVDLTNRDACRAAFDRIVERFEDCGLVLCRVGNAPKFSVPFRTSAPFKKFATKLVPSGGCKPAQLEFLCDGQQFIVAGIHPDTRRPYRWWPKDRDLTTVPRAALPHIDEAAARALVEDLTALLVNEHGFTRPEKPKERTVIKPPGDGARRSPRAVRANVNGLIRVVLGGTPDLDRNKRLFWAACRCREMAATKELVGEELQDALDALHEAARRTGLESSEINRSIASAMRPRS
jgi:hypothetical protein